MISSMRNKCPTKRIFTGKTDLDVSYYQIHANDMTKLNFIEIVDKPYFLYLRLPFGTTPAPSEYKTIGKAEIELGNELLRDE